MAADLKMVAMMEGSTLARGSQPVLVRDTQMTSSDGRKLDFGTLCAACSTALNITDDCVGVGEEVFHQRCLVCHSCSLPLSGSFKVRGKGELLCQGCDARLVKEKTARLEELKRQDKERAAVASTGVDNTSHLSEPCAGCGKAMQADIGVRVNQNVFHYTCLACGCGCGVPFDDGVFQPREGKAYRPDCHKRIFGAGPTGASCPGCRRAIVGKHVKLGTSLYHSACALCGNCGGSLAGGYAMMDGVAMCASCSKKPKSMAAAMTGQFHRGFQVDPITGQKKML